MYITDDIRAVTSTLRAGDVVIFSIGTIHLDVPLLLFLIISNRRHGFYRSLVGGIENVVVAVALVFQILDMRCHTLHLLLQLLDLTLHLEKLLLFAIYLALTCKVELVLLADVLGDREAIEEAVVIADHAGALKILSQFNYLFWLLIVLVKIHVIFVDRRDQSKHPIDIRWPFAQVFSRPLHSSSLNWVHSFGAVI